MTALDHQLQLVPGVEALHRPRRIAGDIVPEPVLVAVGVEDHRSSTELSLEAVGVQLRLLLPDARALTSPLGLDHGQRPSVGAPQHVVDEADALRIWDAADLVLAITRVVEGPPGLAEQHVDEQVPRLCLAVVAVVDKSRGCLCGLDLLTQRCNLRLVGSEQFLLLSAGDGQRGVLGRETGGELLNLGPSERGTLRRKPGIERGPHRHGRGMGRMVERGPHDDVVQFSEDLKGGLRADLVAVMNSLVAHLANDVQLRRDGIADLGLERRVVDESREIVGVRECEADDVVQIADQFLGHSSAVHAGRARIADQVRLRTRAIREQRRKRCLYESEIAGHITPVGAATMMAG